MLVLVSEAIWDFDLEAALKEISEQRREQALKFKFELGQRLCVLAYQLLKQGLREEYGIMENPVFEYNEHGQEIESSEHPASAFIRLWTMKEATMKLIGTGISNDMKSVIDIHTYKYTTVDRQRYIYTVCE